MVRRVPPRIALAVAAMAVGVALLLTISFPAGVVLLVIGAGLVVPTGSGGDDRDTIFDGWGGDGGGGDGGGGGGG